MSEDFVKISAMRRGGHALGEIRDALKQFTQVGTSFEAIEAEAQRLIKLAGMKPSFSTVEGYSWATCIMKNHELCHGIPRGKKVDAGDIITIDVGLICDSYHLDTTTTFALEPISKEVEHFLVEGRQALDKAISKIEAGCTVYDISFAMEKQLKKHGFGAVRELTGHGIGQKLHMWPSIPVFAQKSDKKHHLGVGDTIAVEVMYTAGDPELIIAPDGWTYQTKDGSLSAMFEETVLVLANDHEVLTRA